MTEKNITYKVLLLGDSGVGKTSLIRALTGSPFSHSLLSTVGIDFVTVPFEIDGAKVTLQIWDTAGQERFKSVTRFQYRGTKGLLLVYDVCNKKSFDSIISWIKSVEQDINYNNDDPIPMILVGNKVDLENFRKISRHQGVEMAEKNYLDGFFETSAITNQNVENCFSRLAQSLLDSYNPGEMDMYRLSIAIDDSKQIGNLENNDKNNNNNNNNNDNNYNKDNTTDIKINNINKKNKNNKIIKNTNENKKRNNKNNFGNKNKKLMRQSESQNSKGSRIIRLRNINWEKPNCNCN